MSEKRNATQSLSAADVVRGVRMALERMTIQGSQNAQILAACCNDLDNLLTALQEKEKEVRC